MNKTLFDITLRFCIWLEVKFLGGQERSEWSTELGHVGHSAGGGKLTYCGDTEGDGYQGIVIGRLRWEQGYQLSNYDDPVLLIEVDKGREYWKLSSYLRYSVYRRFINNRITVVREYCREYVIRNLPLWDRDYIFGKLYHPTRGGK